MSEWLTDKEKRLLFSALTREKKVCAEVDKDSLVPIVESLEHKFYYDRLFKRMEKKIRADAIEEFYAKCREEFWYSSTIRNFIDKVREQLNEQNNE